MPDIPGTVHEVEAELGVVADLVIPSCVQAARERHLQVDFGKKNTLRSFGYHEGGQEVPSRASVL